MKLIVLIEDNLDNFMEMVHYTKAQFSIADGYGRIHEGIFTDKVICDFLKMNSPLLLIKYSGCYEIPRMLGDILPEMLVTMSCNKTNQYYAENRLGMLVELESLFTNDDFIKETV